MNKFKKGGFKKKNSTPKGGRGRIVTKIKHDVEGCTSSSGLGLKVFYDDVSERYTGYCFSCAANGNEAYVQDVYKKGDDIPDPPKAKTPEEIYEEVQMIQSCPRVNMDHRGIRAEFFVKWGVRLAMNEYNMEGKEPFSFCFPVSTNQELVGYREIMLEKKAQWTVGDVTDCDLLNWSNAVKAGAKRLYITEGQWDGVALEQMFTDDSRRKYAITSIPLGVGSAAACIGRMLKEIRLNFEEVVLVFDNDEAGREGIKDVQKVLPEVMVVPTMLGIKDANDALKTGKSNIIKTFVDNCKWKAHKPLIEGMMSVSQIIERGIPDPVTGLSYPWAEITEITYGQRYGEATAVAGGVGGGKTVIAHCCAAHNMVEHDVPVSMFLLEEENVKTLRNLAAKIDGIPYHKPEAYAANKDQAIATIEALQGKLFLWNSEQAYDYRFNLEEMLDATRFNALEFGCKHVYIDNMTKIVDQMSPGEANEFINRYSSEMSNLASELGLNIMVFSHLNAPKEGPLHEDGGSVRAGQLTGSKGIMRNFSNLFGFERNGQAPEGYSNNSYISNLKSRDYGNLRKVKTQWSPQTTRLEEYSWEGLGENGNMLYEEEKQKKRGRGR